MKIASASIIIKDKKILLIKRSGRERVFPDCWASPGGKADEGETPEQTAIRETKEEVGLDFEPTELVKTGPYMVGTNEMILYRFYGNWSGDIKIQKEEADDWNWFSYEEAINLKLAFDWHEVIEILHGKELL
ncbi:MAG TPA: NUDIX hydrolase [Patescibacteria group bacterium]|nr:NUDIX hydrolase [Patescibacteria group bacterium]